MKKNWYEIASCTDFSLRMLLISCDGQTMERLAKSFPEYFLDDDIYSDFHLTKDILLSAIEGMTNFDDFKKLIDGLKLEYQDFSFHGAQSGLSLEAPYYIDGPDVEPVIRKFTPSHQGTGKIITYKGKSWLVLWNSLYSTPAAYKIALISLWHHRFVMVPMNSLSE